MKLILTGLVLLTALACLDAVPASQLRKLNAKSTNGAAEDGRVYMTKYRKMREKQIGDELNSRAQTERATGRAIQDNRSLNIKQKKKPIAIVNKKSTSSGSGGVKKLSAQMPPNMHQHQQQQQHSSSFMNMPNQFQQQHQPQQFGSFQQSNGYNERLATLSGASHPTAAHMSPFMQQMGGNPMQQMNPAGMDPFAMHQMLQQQPQMGGVNQMSQGGAPQGAKTVGSKSALQGRAKLSKNKNAGNNALREQRFKMAMDQDFLAKNPNVYKFIVATYGPEFQEQMMKSQMEKMIEMHQEQMQAKQAAEQRKKEQAAARKQQQLNQQRAQQSRAQPVTTTHVDYDDEHIIDQSAYNRRTNTNRNRVSEFDHQEETQRNANRARGRTPEVPKVDETTRARTSSRPAVNQAQPKPQPVEKETVAPRQNVQPVQQRRPEANHISDEDLIHSEGTHEDVHAHEADIHQDVDDHHHEIDEHHEQDQDQSNQRTRSRTTPSNTRRTGSTNRI